MYTRNHTCTHTRTVVYICKHTASERMYKTNQIEKLLTLLKETPADNLSTYSKFVNVSHINIQWYT